MGMFDYIRVLAPLPTDKAPAPTAKGEWFFQTKDAQDCPYMERFTLTEDGRLVHHQVRYEEVPKAERQYPDDDGFLGLCGSMRSVPVGDINVPLHGDLRFCHYDKAEGWWEYCARFTEGKLSRIWLETFEPPEPTDSLQAEAQKDNDRE